MDQEKIKRLESDLRAACVAGQDAAAKIADAGTCNLDSVLVPTGKSHPLKRKSRKLDAVFGAFGGTRLTGGSMINSGYLLSYPEGQAAKRTVATEAAAKALCAWDAHVHYQMD